MKLKYSWSLFAAVLLGCGPQSESPNHQRITGKDQIIVQCAADCAAAEADLVKLGATVNKRYENVAALAVTLPSGQLGALGMLPSIKDVAKTRTIKLPGNRKIEGRSTRVTLAALKDLQPRILKEQALLDVIAKQPLDFGFDNSLNKATVLHKAGQTGKGVVVAIIDSGTANNADIVPALAGSVVGGETFVTGAPATEPSATSTLNDAHGTMTGTMIAGHVGFVFPNTSRLVLALNAHAPGSVQPLTGTEDSLVPMVGTAPEASIYALKVFAADSGGANTADILAAMDRTITLKRNFDRGRSTKPVAGDGTEDRPYVYNALNIQVVNMSLGGASLFPGFEADDLLTLEMLKAGITVAVSAGNDGPNAMTIGSPGSGYGALSVGAANDARHVRVEIDANPFSAPGEGLLYRPSDHLQIAYFSSRGPLADGRTGVHLIANGVANFVQAADGSLGLVDGTSFSAPMVAGAAALLHGAFPKATAAQVREALIKGANPRLVGGKTAPAFPALPPSLAVGGAVSAIDQGSGYLDVVGARDLLQGGTLAGKAPTLPKFEGSTLVQDNIKKAGVAPVVFTNDVFTADIKDLAAGETAHFFVANPPRGRLNVKLDNITFELPPDKQNQLPEDTFTKIKGDRFLLAVTDATLSLDADPWWWLGKNEVNTSYNETYSFSGGVVRVAVRATAINAGKMSGKLTLTRAGYDDATPVVATGSLEDSETDAYKLKLRATTEVTFDLSWRSTWAYYPTHDIDLLLIDPDGFADYTGATLSNPERFSYILPSGDWTVLVDGYMLHGFEDRYRLGIADQGNKALHIEPKKN